MEKLEVDVSELPFENVDNFDLMVINPSNIEGLDFNQPGYITRLINENFTTTVTTDSKTFFDNIAESLRIKDFHENDRNVITHVLYDKPEYFFEIMFLEVTEESNKTKENENQFASLINTYGEKVYGNMIILKTYLSNDDNTMIHKSVTKEDLFEILDTRVNSKVIVYQDGEFREETVRGDMDVFCKNLFEEEYFKKKEMPFLMHNLNMCYLSSEYGENPFPKLIPEKVDTIVFYSMNTDTVRGNISLDEVKKITELSNSLDNFMPKEGWVSDEKDSFGRRVIKNKYRILEYAWQEYKK